MFGIIFIGSLLMSCSNMMTSTMSLEYKFLHTIFMLIGVGLLGFILQVLSNNKKAQIGAVIMTIVGVNLYISNPHTPLDPNIKLVANAELLIKIEHAHKKGISNKVLNFSFVQGLNALSTPKDSEVTTLDDYFKVDIIPDFDVNNAIANISNVEGVEWIEANEVLRQKPLEELKKNNEIDQVRGDKFSASVNDPMSARQWNMEVLEMEKFYNLFTLNKFRPKKRAKLFILDSGVNARHEDLNLNFVSHPSIDKSENESDVNGHGTHCAGVAGAITNNGVGVASMSPGAQYYSISSIRVMNNFGFGSQAQIIEGIIEAVDAGADVISMSIGGQSNQVKEEAYEEAVQYAQLHNVIIVAAAGNNSGDAAKIVPASSDKIIAVSALDKTLKKAQFSNFITNTNYGIAAPGVSILSTWKSGRYAAFDGTSMATPHVAGLLATLKSLKPNLTTKQAFEILERTGKPTKETNLTGKMINPAAAVLSIR
ncbi:MAG: S8 family serine peptidase [Saprospiraceae bacterium]